MLASLKRSSMRDHSSVVHRSTSTCHSGCCTTLNPLCNCCSVSGIRSHWERCRSSSNVARESRVLGDVKLPTLFTAGNCVHSVEAQAGIVLCHHAVLFRWDIDPHDRANAARLALFHQGIEHRELHLSLQHTAAHQPEIHFQCIFQQAANHDRHQAVVAKP